VLPIEERIRRYYPGITRPLWREAFCAYNQAPMQCGEKTRLIVRWSMAAQDYSEAVAKLNSKWVGTPPEKARLKILVNDTRSVVKHAHLAFDNHVAEHGC
jgi:hypothetical protein